MPVAITLRIVGGLSGEALCSIKADRGWRVRDVKAEVSRVEGTPPVAQRLLLEGRCLQDDEKLSKVLPRSMASASLGLVRAVAEAAALQGIEEGRLDLEDLEEDLRGNRDIVLAAVRADGLALEYAAEELKRDRDVVLAAVMESGAALQHATTEVRGDREVVCAAVQQYGQALQYASEELRSDREVGLSAVRRNWKALDFTTEALCGDRNFMLSVLQETRNPEVFRYLSAGLRVDKDIFLAAVRDYPLTFSYAASALQFDHGVVLDVVRVNGRAVGFASDVLKQDSHIMAAAVESAPDAEQWALNYSSYAG